jgi:putative PIN family toxin of toxin-antitoxin system
MCHSAWVKRVVLDTCVVVSAFRSRNGASFQLMRLVADRKLVPLATPALFLEYEDVLKRSDQRQASGLSLDQIDALLAALAVVVEPVDIRFGWRPLLSDPKDEMVVEAAVNGRADALVTHNIEDFATAASRFGLVLMRPGIALQRMRQ